VSLLGFCQWLESQPWSIELHESLWAYPIIESIHVLTLCLFMGLAVMMDLRLLGVTMMKTSVSEVEKKLLPWTIAGFVVMVITGVLLFYAIPVKTYLNIFFRIKSILLILAGINVYIFHTTIDRHKDQWDLAAKPPLPARIAGAVSLTLWSVIIVAGRMIAYNWFDKQA
jgi:hypothetical protein